ncbi:hypothetical protein Ciccas_007675 [Cichlidogyrus casuarinus]|uniref:Uncharacterized protein n=1 Tax=Cichlidogyrus casuarinus TaxID=1844966 RepID=A0ABD2Q4U4_9PLAT
MSDEEVSELNSDLNNLGIGDTFRKSAENLFIGENLSDEEPASRILSIIITDSTESLKDEHKEVTDEEHKNLLTSGAEAKRINFRNSFQKLEDLARRSFVKLNSVFESIDGDANKSIERRMSVDENLWMEDEFGFRFGKLLIEPPEHRSKYFLSKNQIKLPGSDKEPNLLIKRMHAMFRGIEIEQPEQDLVSTEKWFEKMKQLLAITFDGYEYFRNIVDFLPPRTSLIDYSESFQNCRILPKCFLFNEDEQFKSHVEETVLTNLSFTGTYSIQTRRNSCEYTIEWNLPGVLSKENLRTNSDIRVTHNTEVFKLDLEKVFTEQGFHETVKNDILKI